MLMSTAAFRCLFPDSVPSTPRRLEAQDVAGLEVERAAGRERLAVQQVAAGLSVAAAVGAGGCVAPALAEDVSAARLEGPEGADDAVAPATRPLPTAPAAEGVLLDPDREGELEGLDRRVQGVGHGDVDARWPGGVAARALAAAEGLVGGPAPGAQGDVVGR